MRVLGTFINVVPVWHGSTFVTWPAHFRFLQSRRDFCTIYLASILVLYLVAQNTSCVAHIRLPLLTLRTVRLMPRHWRQFCCVTTANGQLLKFGSRSATFYSADLVGVFFYLFAGGPLNVRISRARGLWVCCEAYGTRLCCEIYIVYILTLPVVKRVLQ